MPIVGNFLITAGRLGALTPVNTQQQGRMAGELQKTGRKLEEDEEEDYRRI